MYYITFHIYHYMPSFSYTSLHKLASFSIATNINTNINIAYPSFSYLSLSARTSARASITTNITTHKLTRLSSKGSIIFHTKQKQLSFSPIYSFSNNALFCILSNSFLNSNIDFSIKNL